MLYPQRCSDSQKRCYRNVGSQHYLCLVLKCPGMILHWLRNWFPVPQSHPLGLIHPAQHNSNSNNFLPSPRQIPWTRPSYPMAPGHSSFSADSSLPYPHRVGPLQSFQLWFSPPQSTSPAHNTGYPSKTTSPMRAKVGASTCPAPGYQVTSKTGARPSVGISAFLCNSNATLTLATLTISLYFTLAGLEYNQN